MVEFGVEFGGTARTNRIGKAWTDTKEVSRKWKKGYYRLRRSEVEGQKVTAVQWMDSKVVTMLTSLPCIIGKVKRKRVVRNAAMDVETLTQPSVISAYNRGMGGVDRMDQQIAALRIYRRFRWHLKVLVHVLGICMNNAHITYLNKTNTKKSRCSIRQYVLEVVHELMSTRRTPGACSTHTPTHKSSKQNQKRRKSRNSSTPFQLGQVKEADRPRGYCAYCKKGRSSLQCAECGVWLHARNDETGKDCWFEWHEEQRAKLLD